MSFKKNRIRKKRIALRVSQGKRTILDGIPLRYRIQGVLGGKRIFVIPSLDNREVLCTRKEVGTKFPGHPDFHLSWRKTWDFILYDKKKLNQK